MDARLVLLLLTALSAHATRSPGKAIEKAEFTYYGPPPRPFLRGCLSNNCAPPADKNEGGSENCRVSEGFDQPKEFNLMDEPLILTSSFACCDSCARNPLCKSWVWMQHGFECWLKNDYKPELNTIPCKSCVAYSASGKDYVFEATAIRTTSTESGFELAETAMARTETSNEEARDSPVVMQTQPKWPQPEEWEIEVWDTYLGRDLPGHDLLDKPISVKNDTACYKACRETPDCVGSVWNSQTFECHLKKEWVLDEMVQCMECSCSIKRVEQEPGAPVSPPVEEPRPEPLKIGPPAFSRSEVTLSNDPA